MRLTKQQANGRGEASHIVIAPSSANVPGTFSNVSAAPDRRRALLSEMQRLRGRIALKEGAIQRSDLTSDGRDASAVDEAAWHLLTLDAYGQVAGCVRILLHQTPVLFHELTLSHTTLASCPENGPALRGAVESEIAETRAAGMQLAEIGGWVISESMRCSTQAVRLALGVWAWGRIMGGVVGFATATLRNQSACILGRIGGRSLSHQNALIPKYYEPKYGCDIQILRFASNSLEGRYDRMVERLCGELAVTPVLCAGVSPVAPWRTMHHGVYGGSGFTHAASAA